MLKKYMFTKCKLYNCSCYFQTNWSSSSQGTQSCFLSKGQTSLVPVTVKREGNKCIHPMLSSQAPISSYSTLFSKEWFIERDRLCPGKN